MQNLKMTVIVGLLFSGVQVAALTGHSEREISAGSNKQTAKLGSSKPVKYVNTAQIVCFDDKRTGSRIKKRRCQSIAAWRAELDNQHIRMYLLEM